MVNWFSDEFYRLADKLAAEVERLKARWGEELVRPRLRLFRFRAFGLPEGAIINSARLQVYYGGRQREWNDVAITRPAGDGYIQATVMGDGKPLPAVEDMIREVIDRDGWSEYGGWYEANYE